MGSSCRVLAFGGPRDAAERARRRILELEQRWSRFRPSSELSALNRASGSLVVVSPDTYLLVQRSVDAWTLTGGAFDPTVLPSLRRLGYDRSFDHLPPPQTAAFPPEAPTPAPGCAEIQLFDELPAVVLPEDVQLDPGGIGKGLAADLVVREMLGDGVVGVAVDIGGDVRVAGTNPETDAWTIEVEDPRDGHGPLGTVVLDEGAVATSSTLRRRWHHDGAVTHHLIDPSTGASMETRLLAATVVAGEGWWAEALTKLVYVGTGSTGWPDLRGARALTLDADGVVRDSEREVRAA
jgi:thiamine biosynthesis lipoprotein